MMIQIGMAEGDAVDPASADGNMLDFTSSLMKEHRFPM